MPKALEKTRKSRTTNKKTKTPAKPSAAARKAPTVVGSLPAASAPRRPKTFEDVIGDLTGPPREIARQLRQLVFDLLPGVTETAFGGSKAQVLLYSLGGPTKTLCGIQPTSTGCLLY